MYMKTMKTVLLSTLCSISLGLFAQTSAPKPAQRPIDAVIAKFNEGAAKVNSGDFKTAIADFDEVIILAEKLGDEANDLKTKSQAQLPVLHYQVANALINQKKYEEAIPELEKAVELADLYNNNQVTKEKALKFLPQLLTGVASQKYKEKNLAVAIENFDEAIKYDANYSKAYLGKGKVFSDQSKEKEMLENLNKAIEIAKQAADTKTSEKAQSYISEFYVNQGNINLSEVDPEDIDYSPAIASFEKALESEKDANQIAAINYELGNGYFGIAEYTLACESFNKALVGPTAEKAQSKKEKVLGCE